MTKKNESIYKWIAGFLILLLITLVGNYLQSQVTLEEKVCNIKEKKADMAYVDKSVDRLEQRLIRIEEKVDKLLMK